MSADKEDLNPFIQYYNLTVLAALLLYNELVAREIYFEEMGNTDGAA